MGQVGESLVEGYVVNERFQLLRLLGRGGMGSVWVARHLTLNIDVAIKFIDAALDGREDLRSRFAQEARTAARIQSPHVVNILDYGFDGPNRPFIAMELLQGESLAGRLEREKRLPLAEVSRILAQAAKGLARAHALGIVHRDLKPDNLFLGKDDEGVVVKLLDFGIARDDTPLASASHRTGTGQLLGTPAYMSPEQALGKANIDFRSDLYSLAVVVYHCITGRLPFESDALGELIVSISMKDPPLPSTLLPLPPGLDSWFKCVFQKDPNARFTSAKEMAELFVLACRGGSSPAYDSTMMAPEAFPSGADVGRASRVAAAATPLPGSQGAPPAASWSSGNNPPPSVARWLTTGTPPVGMPVPGRPASMVGTPAPSAHTVGGPPRPELEAPPLPTQGPSSVMVYGLIAFSLLAGLAGGGFYVLKSHPAATANAGLVGTVDGAGNLPPPATASAPAATAIPSAVPSAVPSASASAPTAAAAAPTATHHHHDHPPPASAPAAATPAPAKPPPPPTHTNDYGL